MPPKSKKAQDEDFLMSQLSVEDDDGGSADLAQMFKLCQEKKAKERKKKEAEFFQRAKAAFQDIVHRPLPASLRLGDTDSHDFGQIRRHTEAYEADMAEMESLYRNFIDQYAKDSDRMRAAWKSIATEKARCDEIIERLAKLDLEERERSEASISKATKVAGQSVVAGAKFVDLLHSDYIDANSLS